MTNKATVNGQNFIFENNALDVDPRERAQNYFSIAAIGFLGATI